MSTPFATSSICVIFVVAGVKDLAEKKYQQIMVWRIFILIFFVRRFGLCSSTYK
jgi:hypothetical protein